MTVALLTTIAALTDVFSLVDAGLTPLTTDNVALCNGEPAVIPWSYDDETHISAVTWSKDGAQVMFYLGGSLTVINTKYEFDNATSNAGLKVKTVESTSAGIYTCSVGYQVGFSAPEQRTLDLSGEYITTPPAAPTGSCTEQESSTYLCTCSVTDLGNPAAALQIKVDGGTAQTPANAEVTSGQTVECCVEGKSAKCLTPSSPSSLYCVDVTVPGGSSPGQGGSSPGPGGSSPGQGGCELWKCFIGLIVTIVLCLGMLSLYFFKILEFKCIRSIEFGVKIVSPSAVICVIGMLSAILQCHLSSGCDDDKGWATGVNAVLVIVCLCGSVGIIIVHFKFTDDKDQTTREKTQEHADENRTNGVRGNKVNSTTS